ncbi:hypothetical protein HYR99_35510 [Candidatus Poribacteria bacterium]|nr:hypothetical protein [Candidatus Poribacteria bacterium]
MNTENNDMRGTLTLTLTDRQGRVTHEGRYANRIVTSGRKLVAQLFAGHGDIPPTKVTHIAVGTDETGPTDADIALKAERARKPIEGTGDPYSEIDEGGVKRVRVSLTAVFDFEDAKGEAPLREAGIFTAASEGVMYNRVVFKPVTKTADFKLTLLWDIVF